MHKTYDLVKKLSIGIIFITASALLGYAVNKNWVVVGIISITLIYIYEKRLSQQNIIWHFLCLTIGSALLFIAATFWFINIEASGWQAKIGIFSPSVWLFGILVLCSLFAGLVVAILRIFLRHIQARFNDYTLIYACFWASFLMLSEIILSSGVAFTTRGNGVPLLPLWNFSSIALLMPTSSVFGNIFQFVGLWGVSYFIYLTVALTIELVNRYKLTIKIIYAFIPIFLIAAVASILPVLSYQDASNTSSKIRVYHISTSDASNNYLESLIDKIDYTDQTTLIVLPEYSSLISPFPGGITNNINQDYRDKIKSKIKNTKTFIVGTEDEYHDGLRSPVTYVLDSNLSTLYKKPKEFLVPGGEYLTPWIANLMQGIDSASVDKFYKQRGKSVIQQNAKYPDNLPIKIGVGACSANITPFFYQSQLNKDVAILASNVSFAQFKNAPEYEQFTERFGKLISKSTGKPLVISGTMGNSFIFNSQGTLLKRTKDTVSVTDIALSSTDTPYDKAGDLRIVILLLSPLFILLVYMTNIKLKIRKLPIS